MPLRANRTEAKCITKIFSMDGAQLSKKVQKRNRIPLSCSNCRRKKIKCDRRKPTCRVCEAHKITNCQYFEETLSLGNGDAGMFVKYITENKNSSDESGLSTFDINIKTNSNTSPLQKKETDVSAELKMLNDKIKRLESLIPQSTGTNNISESKADALPSVFPSPNLYSQVSLDDEKNDNLEMIRQLCEKLRISGKVRIGIYDGVDAKLFANAKIGNAEPFSWATIVVKDPFSTPLWQAVARYQQTIKNTFRTSPCPVKSNLLSNHGIDEKKDHCFLGRKILDLLPNKRAIWLFIERFFRYVYPFLPYLDQSSFIEDVERIINGNHITDLKNEELVTKLTLSQQTDTAILGSLMVVIMFAYESLLDNTGNFQDSGDSTPDDVYLSKIPQSNLLINCTESCLNEFRLLKRCQLSVLQCALLLEEYQKVDSFQSFGESDSHIYTGLLIQMATTIGLNRDPAFGGESNNSKNDLLRRKIWYGLIAGDNHQYMQTGIPPSIYPDHYDTKLPWFDEKVSNIADLELERVTIDMMRKKFLAGQEMRKLADLVTNMRENPTIEDLLVSTSGLMFHLRHRLGSFDTILMMDHQNLHYKKVEKTLYMIMYLHALSLLQPVFLHIFYYCQQIRHFDATTFFYNKVLSIWMFVIGNLHNLVYSSSKYFGTGFDLFLVPIVELVMHKGLIIFTSSYIKALIAGKKLQKSNVKNEELIKEIEYYKSEIIMKLFIDVHLPILKHLCKRYFYCWKLLKAHSFIFKSIKEDSIDYSEKFHLFNFMEFFTANNFRTLIQISNWKYYKAEIEMPSWLVGWLQNYRRDIYYIPENEPMSVGKSISSGSDISLSNDLLDGLANDLSYVDEKWLTKMYQKLAYSQKQSSLSNEIEHNQFTTIDTSSKNNGNVCGSTIFNPTLENVNELIPENNMGDFFSSLGLSFDELLWLD